MATQVAVETKVSKAIQVQNPGDPDSMKLTDVVKPRIEPNQALVRIAFSGVNFIDVAMRRGDIKSESPFSLGMEGAGTVESVGSDVAEFSPGDRVAFAMVRGSYAQYAAVPTSQLVRMPRGLDFSLAASVMLQGMTAHYLTHSTYALSPGDTCLVHAAAGGLGGLIVQMARLAGARVIGTVSTPQKAKIAHDAGAQETIIYTEKDFDVQVRTLTNNRGVDIVYDSVGATTFERSLNSLRPRGMLVLLGQTSGPVKPIDPAILSAKGSLFLTRPTLTHYLSSREELLSRANDVLDWTVSGKLKPRIYKIYPLCDASLAHRDFESRQTMGKLLLDAN